MGIGFVILFHLFVIAVFSFVCAVISGVLTYFISGKDKRKRKILLACIAPFAMLYTFYIVGIIGLSIVSGNKKVDIGIGDAWYIPLKNNYEMLFIDIPEKADINNGNGRMLVSGVTKIEEYGNQIFGKTFDDRYFLIDTKKDEVKTFDTEKQLVVLHSAMKLNLVDATEFYSERKDDIMGYWPFLIGVLSLMVSIGAVYIWKLILIF
jgi:hypothetical protein